MLKMMSGKELSESRANHLRYSPKSHMFETCNICLLFAHIAALQQELREARQKTLKDVRQICIHAITDICGESSTGARILLKVDSEIRALAAKEEMMAKWTSHQWNVMKDGEIAATTIVPTGSLAEESALAARIAAALDAQDALAEGDVEALRKAISAHEHCELSASLARHILALVGNPIATAEPQTDGTYAVFVCGVRIKIVQSKEGADGWISDIQNRFYARVGHVAPAPQPPTPDKCPHCGFCHRPR